MKINLEQQGLWFTSDNHFFHTNILTFCNRPFLTDEDRKVVESTKPMGLYARQWKPSRESVLNMNEKMIELHNKHVKPNDIVFFLGDFAFATDEEIQRTLVRLNGIKYLNLGNHDRAFQKQPKAFIGPNMFENIRDYREITVIHPQEPVVDGKQETQRRQKIILFHFPIASWNHAHHGAWHLHGHTHGSFPARSTYVDVGVDATFITGKAEYRPFSYQEIDTYMAKQKFQTVDHHYEGDN